jgi:hypothetical protein
MGWRPDDWIAQSGWGSEVVGEFEARLGRWPSVSMKRTAVFVRRVLAVGSAADLPPMRIRPRLARSYRVGICFLLKFLPSLTC